MNKGFFADVLAARPLLWEAMIRADCAGCGPASSAGELAECAEKIGGASLRTWLLRPLRRHGAEGETSSFWDYAEESRRLALLAGSDLDALCRVAGAALHARSPARAGPRRRSRGLCAARRCWRCAMPLARSCTGMPCTAVSTSLAACGDCSRACILRFLWRSGAPCMGAWPCGSWRQAGRLSLRGVFFQNCPMLP